MLQGKARHAEEQLKKKKKKKKKNKSAARFQLRSDVVMLLVGLRVSFRVIQT
jgi:hypothetical protein